MIKYCTVCAKNDFTRCVSHLAVETERAARVAQVGLRIGAGRGQREASARLGKVQGDVVEVARFNLAGLRIPPIQVELMLTDGHVPNILGQRLRLAKPNNHTDGPRLQRPTIR